jgi:aminoglycoside phosphotransferase (APT) family kinase protein
MGHSRHFHQKMNSPSKALNLEKLAARVAVHLAVDPVGLQLVPIATGKHNTSFWVVVGLQRWVLRVAPPDSTGLLFYERRMMRQEPALHEFIGDRTSLPVAKIVAFDFSRTHFDRDYLLMTALPGVPLSDATLTSSERDRVLYQIGTYLRQLHQLTAPDCLGINAYGYAGSHCPMQPQPTWTEAFQVMWNLLLDDVVASGCYDESDRQFMSDLLERCINHFSINHSNINYCNINYSCINCLDESDSPRLLHMDIWSQNILVDRSGHVTGIVDFDRALWGHPELEFAVLDYCGISEPAFWQGYGQERNSSISAQIRQQFYLLYEVQKYMPIAIWRRQDSQRALAFKQKSFALANQLLDFAGANGAGFK